MRNRNVHSLRASLLLALLGLIPTAQPSAPFRLPLALSAPSAPVEYTGCTREQAPVVDIASEQEVIELVNAERAKNGLPPLKKDSHLSDAARYHAADMRQDDYFEHDSYDRVGNNLQLACKWSDRVNQFYSGWSHLAENIAWGYPQPEDVMNGWMDSPGHRANILSPNFSVIGVGLDSGSYWVQDFGNRPDVFPVVINGEAAATDSPVVSLYIYGDWDRVRLRNDGDDWSSWIEFQNVMSWTLPDQPGVHTVTIELSDGFETVTSSDEIELLPGSSSPSPQPPPSNSPSHLTYLPYLDK